MKNNAKTIQKAFLASIPVLSGYLVLGMDFGIVLRSAGYGVGWALGMSLFIYAGSMQFVGIGLLIGGASLLTTALTTLMVNARHLFYGISMVEKYAGAGRKKPYMIFALTDETYSLVCADPDVSPEDYHRYCFLVSLFDHAYWVSGSVLGSLLGNVLPFDTKGVDFALTALFITVFVQQWQEKKDHRPALIGVGSSLLCLLVFGSDRFLIPAMLLITAGLCLLPARKSFPDNASHTEGGAE